MELEWRNINLMYGCLNQGSKSRPRQLRLGRVVTASTMTDTRVKMSKNWFHEIKYFGFIVEGGLLWESSREYK